MMQQEAGRIMGEGCTLKDSKSSQVNGEHRYECRYIANSSDTTAGKVTALYYVFESYGREADAHNTFDTFRTSNQNHPGFDLLANLGDEAFLHTDKPNFYLIVARRGNQLIRLKVSKIPPRTSLAELKNVANELIRRM